MSTQRMENVHANNVYAHMYAYKQMMHYTSMDVYACPQTAIHTLMFVYPVKWTNKQMHVHKHTQ